MILTFLRKQIILIAAILVAIFSFYGKCQSDRKAMQVTDLLHASTDSGKRWIDAYNREHLSKLVLVGERNQMSQLHRSQIDSMAKVLKIKPKQVSGLTTTGVAVSGSVGAATHVIKVIDTVEGLPIGWEGNYFEYSDDYTSMTGYIDIAHKDTCRNEIGEVDTCSVPGSVIIFYNIDVPIKQVVYWRRKHSFLGVFRYGRKVTTMDVSSSNPNVKITNFESLQIKK
jgi:hypothetical protein